VRYILTVVLVVGAFGSALYVRGEQQRAKSPATQEAIVMDERPDVRVQKVDGGLDLQVRMRFAGTCSRAKLVYEQDGEEKVLDATTNCRRSLSSKDSGTGGMQGDGYVSEVDLGGTLPRGATKVRLVLESETGVRVAPIEL
jgi:hypothetical protein